MCNVILIDDDKNQLFLNTILLSEEAVFQSIKTFENPIIALDFLSQDFDPKSNIIVVDISMPQMDAWEFLSKITTDIDDNIKKDMNLFIASHSSNPKDIEKANEHALVNKFIDKFMLVEELTSFAKANIFKPERIAC